MKLFCGKEKKIDEKFVYMKTLFTFAAIIIFAELAAERHRGVKALTKCLMELLTQPNQVFLFLGAPPMFYSVPYQVLNEANEEKEL